MTQFSLAILALQKDSIFAERYRKGMSKMEYWDPMYEDVMNLLAKLPAIAAYIYRRSYKGDKHIPADPKLDWGGNLAHMVGVESRAFKELMRLYLVIHSDHEGGNVSAHTTHLVGFGPVRRLLLPVRRHGRPGRAAPRTGQPGSPPLDHGPDESSSAASRPRTSWSSTSGTPSTPARSSPATATPSCARPTPGMSPSGSSP